MLLFFKGFKKLPLNFHKHWHNFPIWPVEKESHKRFAISNLLFLNKNQKIRTKLNPGIFQVKQSSLGKN